MDENSSNRSESARRRFGKDYVNRDGYWFDVVSRQSDSGLSVIDFCKQEGVPQSSFYAWRQKLGLASRKGRQDKTPKRSQSQVLEPSCQLKSPFIKIEVESVSNHSGVIVEVDATTRIVLTKDFDQVVLKQAVQTLRSI